MKKGFTLAEVLITLGIIGVVAAMTMPSVVNVTQNREFEARLKKTYSELNQISRKYYGENEESLAEFALREQDLAHFVETFMSYYKGSSKVSDYMYYDDISKMAYPLHLLNGELSDTVLCDDGGYHSEVGGKLFLFNNPPSNYSNGPVVCVDLNGYKPPNTFGRDYFVFTFTTDGFVIPMGLEYQNNTEETNWQNNFFVEGSENCSKHPSHAINDAACTYYALQDISPDEEGKSYWKDFLKL